MWLFNDSVRLGEICMAILRNYCNESAIKLEMNLRADKGLIYDRNKKDYLNWIPYILEVTVENDNFIPVSYTHLRSRFREKVWSILK